MHTIQFSCDEAFGTSRERMYRLAVGRSQGGGEGRKTRGEGRGTSRASEGRGGGVKEGLLDEEVKARKGDEREDKKEWTERTRK